MSVKLKNSLYFAKRDLRYFYYCIPWEIEKIIVKLFYSKFQVNYKEWKQYTIIVPNVTKMGLFQGLIKSADYSIIKVGLEFRIIGANYRKKKIFATGYLQKEKIVFRELTKCFYQSLIDEANAFENYIRIYEKNKTWYTCTLKDQFYALFAVSKEEILELKKQNTENIL